LEKKGKEGPQGKDGHLRCGGKKREYMPTGKKKREGRGTERCRGAREEGGKIRTMPFFWNFAGKKKGRKVFHLL